MSWTIEQQMAASRASGAVETELQLQLTAQRLQLEQCRTDYCSLKSNYLRLEDEFAAVKDDLKSVGEDRDRAICRYKCLLEHARQDLRIKQTEYEENKMLTPKRLELMRKEIYHEVENLFHGKLEQLSGDMEHVRHELNRVSHELSLCEAELDQEKKESVKALEDLKQRHESEFVEVQREIQRQRQKQGLESSSDVAQKLEKLQTENAQLHKKIEDLISHQSHDIGTAPDDLGTAPDDLGTASDAVTRHHRMKQTAEQETQIKQLQVEKLRIDPKESGVDREQLSRLLDQIHQLKNDRSALERQAEDLKNQYQLNMSSLRLKKTKEFRELEETVQQLQTSLSAANDELKALKTDMTTEQEKAKQHSQELQTKLEAEWKNFNCLQNDKMELETKLHALEQRRLDEEEERKRLIATVDEKLTNAERAKEDAEHQATAHRMRLEGQERLLDKAQTDYSSTLDLRIQFSHLNAEYQSCLSGQQETVRRLTVELNDAKTELTQSQASWTGDREKMQKELQDLREESTKVRRQAINNLKLYKGRLKVWTIMEKKLKQNLKVLRSEVSRLKIEKESAAYRRPVDALDSEAETRRQLCHLMEKHRQFSALLLPTANQLGLAAAAEQQTGCPDLSLVKED